jgi:peptidoglycan hydrolase-like protein with peptidoglycan-binding domain
VHVVPSYQLHPDPDRYRQIQQALADRGYFTGQVNGEWNDDSVAALRRFQADQKLDGDGKIDALTLRGLGLGAKHDGSTAGTVPLSAATSGHTTESAPPEPDVPAVSELPSETAPPENNPPQ